MAAAALARLVGAREEEAGLVLEALASLLEGGSGGEALQGLPPEARKRLYDLGEFLLYTGGEEWSRRLRSLRYVWAWIQGAGEPP